MNFLSLIIFQTPKVLLGLVAVHKLQVQNNCSKSFLHFQLLVFKLYLKKALLPHDTCAMSFRAKLKLATMQKLNIFNVVGG